MEKTKKQEIYSWIHSIALAIVIAFICRHFLFSPTTVLGASMAPTFENKDKVVISKTTEIHRFDCIVFDSPNNKGENYIKRVIGLPGDHIEMKDDQLYINGKVFDEPYLENQKLESPTLNLTEDFTLEEITGESTVPENMLFVLGDNRIKSIDSRAFGFISYDSIIGEVVFRIYPLQGLGIPK
ncbi:signal peptidase I [Metabacillus malikii]|uniref:Signal peptidase I n=1 Tax=Metabacillus malikii TaxID=1504265 RepID=A0ABT9ZAI2_9BACI|nr:signal peptidase I [Metabacillus malikii]MDQ0229259.1 signal peptidase I [Metabacillus malikii]